MKKDEQKVETTLDYTSKELKKFDPTEAAIANYQKYLNLKIEGIDDKEGLEKVHAARIEVKTKRVEVDKLRKQLNETALTFQRAVNARAKEITEKITPIEIYLSKEEDRILEEKQAIKERKEREEQERIQGRINRALMVGMEFNGSEYSYGEIKLTTLYLKQCMDIEFDAIINEVEEKRAEEKKLEEERRLEQERKEAELKKAQEELERRQREIEEREQALRKAEEEAKKKVIESRLRRLSELKYISLGSSGYGRFTFGILQSQIENLPDDEFDALVAETNKKIEAEEQRRNKLKEEEAQRQKEAEEKRVKELAEKLEMERIERERQKKEEEEAKRLRAERREKKRLERLPDKEKIANYYEQIIKLSNEIPAFKTSEYIEIGKYMQHTYSIMIKTAKDLEAKADE